MALLNPFEDFNSRSIAPLQSTSERLAYLGDLLRNGSGSYAHWGMNHFHGRAQAQAAMADVHGAITEVFLGARCADGLADLEIFSLERGLPVAEALQRLEEAHFPDRCSEAEKMHIKTVLMTLRALLPSVASRDA